MLTCRWWGVTRVTRCCRCCRRCVALFVLRAAYQAVGVAACHLLNPPPSQTSTLSNPHPTHTPLRCAAVAGGAAPQPRERRGSRHDDRVDPAGRCSGAFRATALHLCFALLRLALLCFALLCSLHFATKPTTLPQPCPPSPPPPTQSGGGRQAGQGRRHPLHGVRGRAHGGEHPAGAGGGPGYLRVRLCGVRPGPWVPVLRVKGGCVCCAVRCCG